MIKIRSAILLLLFISLSFISRANDSISIRAWQLHTLDMDYCKKVMDKAHEYNINTIVLSHEIIWATMQLYGESKRTPGDKERGEKIRELSDYARKKELKVWIWTHEFFDIPEEYLENEVVQTDKKGFWNWLQNRYDKVFKDFPEFDGLMITFHETQYKIFDNAEVNSKLSMPDRFRKLISTIYNACKHHEKELVVRTFVYEPEQLKWLKEGLEKTDNNIIVQSKCVPHDWQPFYPHNPVIGAFPGKRQIIEFDCSSEFTGRNHIPYTSPEYFSYRWKYDLTIPEVVGYNARLDHAGYDALFTPNEINLYTLYRISEEPQITPEKIWQEWAEKRYGQEAANEAIKILKPSFRIVNKLFFPQGAWYTNHSRLPEYNYADQRITRITKWYDDEYDKITAALMSPDINTYAQIIEEKDSAINLIQQSLWYLLNSKERFRPQDYDDLQERMTLLLQTGLIWKSHAQAFFGYKLLKTNPELKPLVEQAINNIKLLSSIIPVNQQDKPVAMKERMENIADELQNMINNID